MELEPTYCGFAVRWGPESLESLKAWLRAIEAADEAGRTHGPEAKKQALVQALRSLFPEEMKCERHHTVRKINWERTYDESYGDPRAIYAPCPGCQADAALERQNVELLKRGVPGNLLHADLSNWNPETEAETGH